MLYTKKEIQNWIDRISKYDYICINGTINKTIEIDYKFNRNDYPMFPSHIEDGGVHTETLSLYVREVYQYRNREIKASDEKRYTINLYGNAIDMDLAMLSLRSRHLSQIHGKLLPQLNMDKTDLTENILTKKCNSDLIDYGFNCKVISRIDVRYDDDRINQVNSLCDYKFNHSQELKLRNNKISIFEIKVEPTSDGVRNNRDMNLSLVFSEYTSSSSLKMNISIMCLVFNKFDIVEIKSFDNIKHIINEYTLNREKLLPRLNDIG